MRIPVFVSGPTALNPQQEASRKVVLKQMQRYNLEPRALGRTDYPTEFPLREVYLLAKHCSGGVILGFEQFQSLGGIWKRGTTQETSTAQQIPFPTPWNHLEAGILYSLGLPLLVFAEDGVSGGIFDHGVSDVFIHRMPVPKPNAAALIALEGVFQKWQSAVRTHYYR